MKELWWQISKNKGYYILSLIVFGGCLVPFFILVGGDSVIEACYRMVMFFIGMSALWIFQERAGILKQKTPGWAFYHSMPEGAKKEKSRVLILDAFFLTSATAVFLLYKVIGAFAKDCFDGGFIYAALLLYVAAVQLLAHHPYLLLCVTVVALILVGGGALITLPFVGVVIGIALGTAGMACYYHRLDAMWNKEA